MKIVVFDDWKSFFHAVLGFFSGFLGPYGLVLLVPFLMYQFFEHIEDEEPVENTLGDIAEFLIGAGISVYVPLVF